MEGRANVHKMPIESTAERVTRCKGDRIEAMVHLQEYQVERPIVENNY